MKNKESGKEKKNFIKNRRRDCLWKALKRFRLREELAKWCAYIRCGYVNAAAQGNCLIYQARRRTK